MNMLFYYYTIVCLVYLLSVGVHATCEDYGTNTTACHLLNDGNICYMNSGSGMCTTAYNCIDFSEDIFGCNTREVGVLHPWNEVCYNNAGVCAMDCNVINNENDPSVCYNFRSHCHYNPFDNTCVHDPPSDCFSYQTDTIGCNAATTTPTDIYGCQSNNITGMCWRLPAPCNTLNSLYQCQLRSDCTLALPYGCMDAPIAGRCAGFNSYLGCRAHGCLWDVYVNQCFVSLSEIDSVYPCSTWTNFEYNACSFHGCHYDSIALMCRNPGDIMNVTTDTTSNIQFKNPTIAQDSSILKFEVWVPNTIPTVPAHYTYITIGTANTVASQSITDATGSICNNVEPSVSDHILPPIYTFVSDPVGLQLYLNSWINTNHNMDFSAALTDANATLLDSLMGRVNTGSTSLVKSIDLDPTNQFIIYRAEIDYLTVTSSHMCATAGASHTLDTSFDYFFFPTEVIRVYGTDPETMLVTGKQTTITNRFDYTVRLNRQGTIANPSVGVSIALTTTLFAQKVQAVYHGCSANQAVLQIDYMLVIGNAFTTDVSSGQKLYGILSDADISFINPDLSASNCYSEHVSNIQNLQCQQSSGNCYVTFTVTSGCRVVDKTGLAFETCPVPTHNMKHDLYVDVSRFQLDVGGAITNAVLTSLTPVLVPFTLDYKVYKDSSAVATQNWQVSVGVLPTPTDTNMADFISTIPGSTVVVNPQIKWSDSLAMLIGMTSPTLQSVSHLAINYQTIKITSNYFDPNTQAFSFITFNGLFPFMSYVPKGIILQQLCPFCKELPIMTNRTAFDGFAIPITQLRLRMPGSTQYSVSFDYQYFWDPTGAADSANIFSFNTYGLSKPSTKLKLSSFKTKTVTTTVTSATSPKITVVNGTYVITFTIDDVNNPNALNNTVILTSVSNMDTSNSVNWTTTDFILLAIVLFILILLTVIIVSIFYCFKKRYGEFNKVAGQ